MRNLTFFLTFLIVGVFAGEEALRFFDYCKYYNYPVEDHIVHTEDRYNLQYYRIQAKNTNITHGKRVVYLMHGFADSSDSWIINNESIAPAFYFANQGFDVWLGNSRGNRYSNHKMSPNVAKFWNFTFDQMALFDLPASLRYINGITNRKIHYIGHSQGATIMLIALAEKLKGVEEFLHTFTAFAPCVYLKHQSSQMIDMMAKTHFLRFLHAVNVKQVFTYDDATMLGFKKVCQTPGACEHLLTYISQMNNTVNNLNRSQIIITHFPAGTSIKDMMHFTQYANKDIFNKYDYGKKKNKVIYGQKKAPIYDLSKIAFPVHLYVGRYDKIVTVKDSNRLFKELTNSVNKTIKFYDFGHATFAWGKTVTHLQDAIADINNAEPA